MGQTLLQIALRQEGKAAGARQPKKNTSIVKRPSQTSASVASAASDPSISDAPIGVRAQVKQLGGAASFR